MLQNISFYSYGSALVAYLALSIVLLVRRRGDRDNLGNSLLAATLLTALWAASVVASSLAAYPQVRLMQLAEVARNAAWSFLLLQMLGQKLSASGHLLASRRWQPWFLAVFAGILAILLAAPYLSQRLALGEHLGQDLAFVAWVGMAVLGLLLLEQIYRNGTEAERWEAKFLCLGLGFIFAYDFFMYAEALLFRSLDAELWQARGFVVALAAVLLAIGIARRSRSEIPRTLYLSRHVVFHSVTLFAAGIYLMLMALAGYFIRYLGGGWGGVLQIAFLCASGLLLLTLLFSGQIRARTRVWLSKNFFSYKYDYRTEWLQFTRTLAEGGDNIPENIIRAMAQLTRSPGGLLWARAENGQYQFVAGLEAEQPENVTGLQALAGWLQSTEWIIDLHEWRNNPDLYEHLEPVPFLTQLHRAWLIVPLLFTDTLQGILLLRESDLQRDINWEDRDLLKVAGRQAASHLAQFQANQALVESRQFEAFNRLSAYVIHDLKNILAQQSLIVSNASRHRDNPAFIDDVLETVNNSVQRMTRLMEQMRSGVRGLETRPVDLAGLLADVVSSRGKIPPSPTLEGAETTAHVLANREQLSTVFNHLVQNAQEATDRNGRVTVRLATRAGRAVVEIQDTGAGMSPEFLRERLFKPFDSTKGLTGMGIGAFESRELVRKLGGDIQVSSSPGAGSLFQVLLPLAEAQPEIINVYKEAAGE